MKTKQTKPKTVPQAAPPPDPLAEIVAFVTEQRALKLALQTAERRVTKAEAELSEARSVLAESESARLVEAGDVDDVELDLEEEGPTSPESAAFIQCSLALEQARAARGGCLKRIRDKDVELLSVAEKLTALRDDYNTATIAQFLEQQFQPAAAAFAAVLRRGESLTRALGRDMPEIHRLPDRSDWQEDEAAQRIYKQHSAPRELTESLVEFRDDAQRRVLRLEREKRHRAGFDPTAKYRTIREFSYDGKEFEVDAVVDRHVIDLRTLGLLYSSKRLAMIDAKEEWSQ